MFLAVILLSLVAFPVVRIFNKFRDTAPLTLIKDHGIFSLVIILLILITLSLDNVWILLGENWCWSPLTHKGLIASRFLVRVIMVVGAGRGPLVRASLTAGEESGRKVRVYAVEKNPNAVVTWVFLSCCVVPFELLVGTSKSLCNLHSRAIYTRKNKTRLK